MNNNSENNLNKDPAIKTVIIPQKRFARGVTETVLAIIAILTVISAVLLTIRLVDYINVDEKEVLLQSDFSKQLEIFSVRYDNKSGEISVSGMDGQKVVAPGTKTEYTVRLRNKDKIAIDYELVPTLSYTTEHSIPILFRMIDGNGDYLIGDAKTWVAIENISQLSDKKTLVKGASTEYVFEWKWDFESGDDEYDTFLGSIANSEDVGLSVTFDLRAEANTDIGANGGVVDSGLIYTIVTAVALTLLTASTILMTVYFVKRYKLRKASLKGLPSETPIDEGKRMFRGRYFGVRKPGATRTRGKRFHKHRDGQ